MMIFDQRSTLFIMPATKQTAILIFARDVHEEICEKKLFGLDTGKNSKLFQALNRNIVKSVQGAALPYYRIASKDQVGENFADRYKNAIRTIFDKGFERVIIVGNDSPELSSLTIKESEQHLLKNDVVYGRTTKGGIYTLGLTRKGFDQLDFNAIPWQSNGVATYFDKVVSALIQSFSLQQTFDELNEQKDVWLFIKRLTSNFHDRQLFGELFNLVFDTRIPSTQSQKKLNSFFESNLVLRGPPCLS